MHKTRFTTKTLVRTKTEIYISILYVRFIKLHVCLVLFCKSQSLWNWVLCINEYRNASNHLFAFRYLCLLHHSLDLSMRRTAKKCNITDCVTSRRFASRTQQLPLRMAVAICSACTINSSHVPPSP